jgi:hypothetical protein
MHTHHEASLQRVIEYFQNDAEVEALLLGGSLAHDFAEPASDVDVMMVVSDQAYDHRRREGRLQFFNQELCTYPEGYVDGKYLPGSFLSKVAEQGSEPARFAFQDARILFSRVNGLPEVLQAIVQYPRAGKETRLSRFLAQFEAWHWYAQEALKRGNRYLLNLSISKLALFGGRLILTHNELLYPYHKWFLRVLAQAPDKPADLLIRLQHLQDEPARATVEGYYECVKGFRAWTTSTTPWPHQFMLDSELNWLDGSPPVDDL